MLKNKCYILENLGKHGWETLENNQNSLEKNYKIYPDLLCQIGNKLNRIITLKTYFFQFHV